MASVETTEETDAAGTDSSSGSDATEPLLSQAARWISSNRGPSALLMASCVLLAYLTVSSLSERPPLYWDEAVYASRGRFFIGELDNGVGYWADYRAPGLPFLIAIGFRVFGTGALAVRLPAAVFGVALLVLVFLLGLLVVDAWVGAVASLVMSLSYGFTRFTAFGVPDVPGAALGVAAMVVALWAWRRGPLHPIAYGVVPLLAALATYVRFGAPIALGIGLVAVVIFVGWTQWSDRAASFAREAVTLGGLTLLPIVLILMVPALTRQSTAPFVAQRRYQEGRAIPVADSVGESVAIIWPDGDRFDFFQPLVFFTAMGFAIAGLLIGLARPALRRATVFCVVGLGFTLVGLNVALDHMETRYLIVALPFLSVLVGIGVVSIKGLVPSSPVLGWVSVLAASALVIATVTESHDRHVQHARQLEASFGLIEEAGARLAGLGDPDCVVLSGRSAQTGWYTRCRSASWLVGSEQPITEQIRTRVSGHADPVNLYVFDIPGHNRQPDSSSFDGPLFELVTELGDPGARSGFHVRIFRVDDCVRDDTCP